jgi:organic radical activating enzyme
MMSYTQPLSNTLPVAAIFTEDSTTVVKLASPRDHDYCEMTLEKIAAFVPPQTREVTITGCEPIAFGDTLGILLSELTFRDLTIHLETSGTIDPPEYWKSNGHIRWLFRKGEKNNDRIY